jgi:hypothetical protein
MTHTGFSRRRFFYGTLLAGAVPAGGFGSVPTLKALGYKSYNEKLNIACIGVGGRGADDLNACASENVELMEQEEKSKWTYPSRSVLRFDFPARGNMPPVSLYWHDAAKADAPRLYRPKGLENERILPAPNNLPEHRRKVAARDVPAGSYAAPLPSVPPIVPGPLGALYDAGSLFIGYKGYMACALRGEGVQLLSASRWEKYRLPAELLPRPPEHHRDWIRACKGGEPACSNFSIAGPFNEWLTLGAVAYHFDGKLEWDSSMWRFTNNNEANKYLKPVCRKGWELKL